MLKRLGGHPSLDFINTVDPREGNERTDYLRTFTDAIDWARAAGVLKGGEARQTAAAAADDERAAARAFNRTVALREAMYAIFAAIGARRPIPSQAMDELESAYRDAMAHARFVRRGSAFYWQLSGGLDIIRWRIARGAVALLESDRLGRVKRCPGGGAGCGWLFLDRSKNASRRWCSMEGCGNYAKMRRFRRKRTLTLTPRATR
jgi:predicted RNA-binding Zn ribbon-like protein